MGDLEAFVFGTSYQMLVRSPKFDAKETLFFLFFPPPDWNPKEEVGDFEKMFETGWDTDTTDDPFGRQLREQLGVSRFYVK